MPRFKNVAIVLKWRPFLMYSKPESVHCVFYPNEVTVDVLTTLEHIELCSYSKQAWEL